MKMPNKESFMTLAESLYDRGFVGSNGRTYIFNDNGHGEWYALMLLDEKSLADVLYHGDPNATRKLVQEFIQLHKNTQELLQHQYKHGNLPKELLDKQNKSE